jgi:hypothetical protein
LYLLAHCTGEWWVQRLSGDEWVSVKSGHRMRGEEFAADRRCCEE